MTLNVYVPVEMETMFTDVTDTDGLTDALTRSLFSALVEELRQLSVKNHDLVDDELKQQLSSKDEINELIEHSYYYLFLALRKDRTAINNKFSAGLAIRALSIAMINIKHILANDALKHEVNKAFEGYDCSTEQLKEILKVAKVEFNALNKKQ